MMSALHTRAPRPGSVALLLCTLALAGCGTTSPVGTVEGGLLRVDCDGGYHDWSACFAAASKHCGDPGYRIVAQISDEGGAVGTRDWSREGSVVSRTMEFRCGE